MEPDISSITDLKIENLKSFAKKAYNDIGKRRMWAANVNVWSSIMDRLDQDCSIDTQLELLRFANNLSACEEAGIYVLESQFCSRLVDCEFDDATLTRLKWQVLANLSFGFKQSSPSLFDLANELTAKNFVLSENDQLMLPMYTFYVNLVALQESEYFELPANVSQINGVINTILHYILIWMNDTDESYLRDRLISLSTRLFAQLIKRGLLPLMVSKVAETDEHKLLTLLKIVDGTLSSDAIIDDMKADNFWESDAGVSALVLVRDILVSRTRTLLPLIGTTQRTLNVICIWNEVCICLDLAASLLTLTTEEVVSACRETALHTLIELLIEAKSLPQISKLKDQSSEIVNTSYLPFLRSKTLAVLSVLVEGNAKAQKVMRERGGLAAVLECCVIDGNNPFMKESAIVCIRYLLENCLENQEFVASMEAKQVADTDALHEAGYEVDIKDGKLTVKKPHS